MKRYHLNNYCSKPHYGPRFRPELAEPFVYDGCAWATDGVILVKVMPDTEEASGVSMPATDGINVEALNGNLPETVFDEAELFNITLDRLSCKHHPRMVYCPKCCGGGKISVCPDCTGSGTVSCPTCGQETTCDHCGGSGKPRGGTVREIQCPQCAGFSTVANRKPVCIFGCPGSTTDFPFRISTYHHHLLVDLPHLRLRPPAAEHAPLYFTFSGGRGALMPIVAPKSTC